MLFRSINTILAGNKSLYSGLGGYVHNGLLLLGAKGRYRGYDGVVPFDGFQQRWFAVVGPKDLYYFREYGVSSSPSQDVDDKFRLYQVIGEIRAYTSTYLDV